MSTQELHERLSAVFGFGDNFESKSLEESMEVKVIRHVRTPAGVKRYKQPIGSVIVAKGSGAGKLLDAIKEIDSPYPGWNKYEGKNGKKFFVGKEEGLWFITDEDDNEVDNFKTEEAAVRALNDTHAGGGSSSGRGGGSAPKSSSSKPASSGKAGTSSSAPAPANQREQLAKWKKQDGSWSPKNGDKVIVASLSNQRKTGTYTVEDSKSWSDSVTLKGSDGKRLTVKKSQIVKHTPARVKEQEASKNANLQRQAANRSAFQVGDEISFTPPGYTKPQRGRVLRRDSQGRITVDVYDQYGKTGKRFRFDPNADGNVSKKSVDGLDLYRQAINATQVNLLNKVNGAIERKDLDSAQTFGRQLLNDVRANGMRDNAIEDIELFVEQF